MFKVCLIKTTTSSLAEAEKLAMSLVKAHLAACVQISEPGKSVYRWQGRLESEQEYYLTIKTSPSLREAAVTHLTRQHPYELPEIVWAEFNATDDYGNWVNAELGDSIAADAQE